MGKPKKGKPDPSSASEGGGFDMTPMIDVTFLLIIFFMCVTEMADASKSKLKLPRVKNGEEDTEPAPGRMVINIMAENKEMGIVDGQMQVNQKNVSRVEMGELIKQQVAIGKKDAGGNSDKPFLIRADKRVKYKSVQDALKICLENKVWRISFTALAPKDPNAPLNDHDR